MMKHHKCITRYDRESDRMHCWKVEIRRNNHQASCTFSDCMYGSKHHALQKAIAWRDAMLVTIGSGESHDNICRVDYGDKTHWRVELRSRTRVIKQRFSVEDYGDVQMALNAALSWRDAMVGVAKEDRLLRRVTVLRNNNSSGIVGVGRYISLEKVGDKLFRRASWMASWVGSDGKSYKRKFSVVKYGELKAKSMACAARANGVADLLVAERFWRMHAKNESLDNGLHIDKTSL